jgi:hypothetical protein
MKTLGNLTGLTLLLLLQLLPGSVHAVPQDPYTGLWEGSFMGDFRTEILISSSENGYSGKMMMYSGPQMIQDDPLTEISIEGMELTFQIPAKETSFIGQFNEEITALTGRFIFPDGSEHPLEVQKKTDRFPSEEATREKYLEYRNRRYEPESLKRDLFFLMERLKEYHPRLYSYTSQKAMDEKMEQLLTGIDRPMGLEEYFRLISPLVDMVQCSHTGIRLPMQYQQLAHACGNYIPLHIAIDGGRGFYLSLVGQPDAGIAPGTEISKINGVPFREIVEALLPLIPSEGSNSTSKYYQLNRSFQHYYYLLDPSERYEVEFLTPPSIATCTFNACKLEEVDLGQGEPMAAVPLSFSLNENGSAGILRLESFEIHYMEGYMLKLDSIFQLLSQRNTQKLVLDLRGNSGGHPIFAAQLLSYLVPGDFVYFKRNPEVEEFEPLYHPMHPSPWTYGGDIYVMVDGGCLSTTGHLISLIKYHTPALFLGEEPGSSFICNDYSIRLTLPETAIEVNIPRATFETAVSGFKDGIPFPVDFPVSRNPTDQLLGIDAYLVFWDQLMRQP